MSSIATSPILGNHQGISTNIVNQDLGTVYVGGHPGTAHDLLDVLGGLGAATLTPSISGSAKTGGVGGGYGADWYNRAHVIPSVLDLGNLLQTQTRSVEVWNAHFVQKTLTAVGEQGTEGITLVKPFGEPAVYEPLQSETYDVQVTLAGPPVIDALFTFDFGAPDEPTLTVSGDRVVIFPYSPQRPLTEALEFLTDVMEGYEGTEQRAMVRNLARQFYTMFYRPGTAVETATMLNTIFGHLGRVFGVPLFQFKRTLLADASITDTSVQVDTTFADFRGPGGLALLWRSSTDFETVEVDAVQPGQLDLARPLEQAHTAGDTLVVPMQLCLATDPVNHSRTGNGKTRVEVSWQAIEFADLSADDGDLTLYKSAPVVGDLNILSGDDELREAFVGKAEVIDNRTGAVESVVRRLAPEVASVKTWDTDDPQEAWETRQLLYALRGRQRTFWLPTFRQDFVLADTVGAADTDIEVVPVEYDRFVGGQAPLDHVAIYLNDGTVFFREILSSTVALSGNEQLNLDSALGQEVQTGDVLRISYLVRCRLGADRIEFEHRRPGSVRVSAPVVGVIQ